MLDLLGLDPLSSTWSQRGDESTALRKSLDVLVESLLERREAARAARDFATADAVRDQLRAAGLDIEDTPSGPRWTVPAPEGSGT